MLAPMDQAWNVARYRQAACRSGAVALPLGQAQVDDVAVQLHRRRGVADAGAFLHVVVDFAVRLRQVEQEITERRLQLRRQSGADGPRTVGDLARLPDDGDVRHL